MVRVRLRASLREDRSRDVFFFFNDTATTEIYTLSLHDALPICPINPTVASGSKARAPSSIPRPARRTGTRHTGPEISSASVSASGVFMRARRVGISRVASATMIVASSFIACLNSGVGVRSSRRTASLCRTSGPSTTRRFFASSIEREGLGEGGYAVAQALELAAGGPRDDLGDLAHLVRPHAAGGHGGGAEPDAARDRRLLGIVRGHVFTSEERRVGEECRSRWSPHH